MFNSTLAKMDMLRKQAVLVLFTCLILTSCSALKASPAKDSGFLQNPELMKEDDNVPFHAVWEKDYIDGSKYDSLYIAPINTEYLRRTGDWAHIEVLSREEIIEEARKLASYFRRQLKEELKQAKATVVDRPTARTVVLEIAIVELIPTDVVRNAAGTVIGMLVPGGGLVSAGAGGSIAIEGRFVAHETGTFLARFKDREKPKIAPVDLGGLTPFQHAKNSIDDWSVQIGQIISNPERTPIADSSPFTFSPW